MAREAQIPLGTENVLLDIALLTARLTALATEDPELARIIDAWPALSAPIRRAIQALIASAG